MLGIHGRTAGRGNHRPARPAAKGMNRLTEADVPDVPLLLVDGYALPVTVRSPWPADTTAAGS